MLALLMMLAATAQSEVKTLVSTQELLVHCEKRDSFCTGYVAAAVDSWMSAQAHGRVFKMICLPPSITRDEVVDDVVAWLKAHPDLKNLDEPNELATGALIERYSCLKK